MNGFSTGEEDSRGPTDQICCLIDNSERCSKVAGNASYSKRIQNTVAQKRLNLSLDNTVGHFCICDLHKRIIQSAKDSEVANNEVDLHHLQINTLRRYQRRYEVLTRPGLNKAQLADNIMKHFKTIPIVKEHVLTYFIYTVKTNGNKLDQKNGLNSSNDIM
ncbi:unnamed protein product [Ceutorhynchus assimilis]|uniref:Histone deacetylase complex subunit SAP30 Sin3 binding domain-containing protein n=1 Tax=Ceutorhynchus assimilis TaxID=467358 RepID=A0A9N9MY88_9CUCU|nr:unnamed protein product [Ceutorhynchus assimilis]